MVKRTMKMAINMQNMGKRALGGVAGAAPAENHIRA